MRDDDTNDPKLFGLYTGEVVSNEDPLGLGRVRIRIPGLCEPYSAWALPLGMPGAGSADRGTFWPPAEKAEVGVLFKQGDVDQPYYLTANYGKPGGTSEVPGEAKTAGKDAPKVKVVETDVFRVTFDDRDTKKNLLIENKETGDQIEIDGLTAGIQVNAKAALVLKAVGVISIEGGQVVIQGRVVAPIPDPI
jgi:uncharacterized protein involved in type VI secretion and phage assembly